MRADIISGFCAKFVFRQEAEQASRVLCTLHLVHIAFGRGFHFEHQLPLLVSFGAHLVPAPHLQLLPIEETRNLVCRDPRRRRVAFEKLHFIHMPL
jgi:hypothetical protein